MIQEWTGPERPIKIKIDHRNRQSRMIASILHDIFWLGKTNQCEQDPWGYEISGYIDFGKDTPWDCDTHKEWLKKADDLLAQMTYAQIMLVLMATGRI